MKSSFARNRQVDKFRKSQQENIRADERVCVCVDHGDPYAAEGYSTAGSFHQGSEFSDCRRTAQDIRTTSGKVLLFLF